MPLTKEDALHLKGVAILGMVMLHLFCRLENLPYTPLVWIGDVPLIYYVGLFGDICVPIYCFCSGYAHYLLQSKQCEQYSQRIPRKILRFLTNYWIVVVLFSVLGLLFDRTGAIPGFWRTFAGNMLVVDMSYNGAWWFVSTYLFLLILSPISFRIAEKVPGVILLLISGTVYLAAYLCRFNIQVVIPNKVLNWIWNQIVLLGTSQFPYFLGALAFKYHAPEKLRGYFIEGRRRFPKAVVTILLPILAFIGHGIVQSLVIAPITAMIILTSLTLAELPKWILRGLAFLGKHSTNIWLVHMFFYLTLFKDLVFYARYPVLIALFMFVICIGVSYIIEFINQPICKKIR